MNLTENERLHASMFDRAMELRDAARFDEAMELLRTLLSLLQPDDRRLSAHSHMQLGHILEMRGRVSESEGHFREAVAIVPSSELPSLAWFHALRRLERHVDAARELLRFLSMRESLGYRELLADDSFTAELPDHERHLVDVARSRLAKHREAQRTRAEPTKGDTVRIRSNAHDSARPGSLACVREVGSTLFRVEFSDGTSLDLPAPLLDHVDI